MKYNLVKTPILKEVAFMKEKEKDVVAAVDKVIAWIKDMTAGEWSILHDKEPEGYFSFYLHPCPIKDTDKYLVEVSQITICKNAIVEITISEIVGYNYSIEVIAPKRK